MPIPVTFNFQDAFNISIILIGFLGGFILSSFRNKIDSLTNKDAEIADEVHKVHLLIAGEYIKRPEFESSLKAVFDSLRRIEDKLGTKVDK